METSRKPFEMLSGKERQVFDLCGEVIEWGSNPDHLKFPGVAELKEGATKLFAHLQGMDFDYDDKYYQIYQEYEELRRRFDHLKHLYHEELEHGAKILIKIDITTEDVPSIIEKIKKELADKKKIEVFQDWHGHGYGDYVSIEITMSSPERCESLKVKEMYDHVKNASDPHTNELDKLIKDTFSDRPKTFARLHDFGGYQFDTVWQNLTTPQMLERLSFILEQIKKTPRVFKPGQP